MKTWELENSEIQDNSNTAGMTAVTVTKPTKTWTQQLQSAYSSAVNCGSIK